MVFDKVFAVGVPLMKKISKEIEQDYQTQLGERMNKGPIQQLEEELNGNNKFMKRHKFYLPQDNQAKKTDKLSVFGINFDAFHF